LGDTSPRLTLTHEGAFRVLQAAVEQASAMQKPQCIAVVDGSGHLLAFVRMDGAKFLSIQTAQRKAVTAADRRSATGGIEHGHGLSLGLVTDGRLANLKGGVPIEVDGQVLGAVGVSSGSGEEDLEVALAGVGAIARARTEW
jgi:glc operon protein GlcG